MPEAEVLAVTTLINAR